MTPIVLTIIAGVGASTLSGILAFLVRISRQLARIVQYFDSESPVSEAMGGTLPVRLKAVEEWATQQRQTAES
jgi:hypothetical protein